MRRHRDERVVHDLLHARPGHGEDQAAQLHVVQKPPLAVHHVDHVDRLAILPLRPDVGERLLDRPLRPERHVVRRHEPAHALRRVPQEPTRFLEVPGCEKVEQPLRHLTRKLFQELSAVIRREAGQQIARFLVRQALEQRLLPVRLEVRERLSRLRPRQRAEQQHAIRLAQLGQAVCDLRCRPVGHRFAERRPVPRADQFRDVQLDDVVRHASLSVSRKATLAGRNAVAIRVQAQGTASRAARRSG